jgi:hypothetical protein
VNVGGIRAQNLTEKMQSHRQVKIGKKQKNGRKSQISAEEIVF